MSAGTDRQAPEEDEIDLGAIFTLLWARKLRVMDLTAITLCAEGNLAVTVFDISDPENLLRILDGDSLGTRITKEPPQ